MLYLEDRIVRIAEMALVGKDEQEIAKSLELRVEDAGHHIDYELVLGAYDHPEKLEAGKKIGRKRIAYNKIEQIQRAIEYGAKSVDEIANLVYISNSSIRKYSFIYEIKLPKKRYQEKNKLKVKELRDSGMSTDEIAKELGLKKATIISYGYSMGVSFDEGGRRKRRKREELKIIPERDELIKKGLTLEEISQRVGVTREAIRIYINSRGQYNEWRKAREYNKYINSKKKVSKSLLYVLKERLKDLCKKEGWAYEKAFEYCHERKNIRLNFEKAIKLFSTYDEARSKGNRLSLGELAKINGLSSPNISRIFKRAEIEPMYGNRKRKRNLSQDRKESIIRSSSINMSSNDIGYFLGENYFIVQRLFTRENIKRKGGKKIRVSLDGEKFFIGGYRHASQIYEALDLGLSSDEVSELLDIPMKAINYTITYKPKIEREIISALNILYPDRIIERPYLEKS